jgi:hypothetical protein
MIDTTTTAAVQKRISQRGTIFFISYFTTTYLNTEREKERKTRYDVFKMVIRRGFKVSSMANVRDKKRKIALFA